MSSRRPVLDPKVYTQEDLVDVLRLSDEQIRKHIAAGHLIPKYSGTKKIFPVKEIDRFLDSLPDEPKALRAS